MGGLPSKSSDSTLGNPKCARIKYSFPPGIYKKEHKNENPNKEMSKIVGGPLYMMLYLTSHRLQSQGAIKCIGVIQ